MAIPVPLGLEHAFASTPFWTGGVLGDDYGLVEVGAIFGG